MNAIEKAIGLKFSDFRNLGATAKQAVSMAKTRYFQETPLKM